MLPGMSQNRISDVFEGLTSKQAEALSYAARGMTSKEIARELDISPHSVDKRINSVRAQLSGISRGRLARAYREWPGYHSLTGQATTVPETDEPLAVSFSQPRGEILRISDAIGFDARASWASQPLGLRPGYKPVDFGSGAKLLMILGGALLIAAVFVLIVTTSSALWDFFDR